MTPDSSPNTFPAHPELDALLQEVRQVARRKHHSIHTEDSYAHTIRRFIDFHGRRHPRQLGAVVVRDHLNRLAFFHTP